ncbi:VOC family protein [Streptomyces sp. NPDC047046]|uniref:VOC family protein n=1 Tax=unclassified Streptomyces TaxID=2593676 RepID=UPI0034071F4E
MVSVRRVVPVLRTHSPARSREFFALLGMEQVMDHGWIATHAAPATPAAQLSTTTGDATGPVTPVLSIEVDDVDAAYETLRASGAEVLFAPRDEEWGVRRFFVREPGSGAVLNVLAHGG